MTDTPRAIAVIVALLGLCALLIMLATGLGSDRPSVQFSGTEPGSDLSADYAVDVGMPMTAPLDAAILDAAQQDRRALGLPDLEQVAPPPRLAGGAASDLAASTAANEASQAEQQTGGTGDGVASAIDTPAGGPGMPWLPIAAVVMIVGVVAWGALFVLRPSKD